MHLVQRKRRGGALGKKRPPEGGLYTASTVGQHTQNQDDKAEENAGAHFGATGFILVLTADGGDQLGGEDKGQYGHNDNGGIGDAVHRSTPFTYSPDMLSNTKSRNKDNEKVSLT